MRDNLLVLGATFIVLPALGIGLAMMPGGGSVMLALTVGGTTVTAHGIGQWLSTTRRLLLDAAVAVATVAIYLSLPTFGA